MLSGFKEQVKEKVAIKQHLMEGDRSLELQYINNETEKIKAEDLQKEKTKKDQVNLYKNYWIDQMKMKNNDGSEIARI